MDFRAPDVNRSTFFRALPLGMDCMRDASVIAAVRSLVEYARRRPSLPFFPPEVNFLACAFARGKDAPEPGLDPRGIDEQRRDRGNLCFERPQPKGP